MNMYTILDSPVGELLLAGQETRDGVALTSVSMTGQRNAPRPQPGWKRAPGAFAGVARQLEAYFAGELTVFDLSLATKGTPFQQRVWRALDSVRYGTTITYGELAAQLGVPRDRVVALGGAVGANPLLIVRPCHRVVGADGMMRGYAGGVERKQWLLAHEGALLPESSTQRHHHVPASVTSSDTPSASRLVLRWACQPPFRTKERRSSACPSCVPRSNARRWPGSAQRRPTRS